MGSIPTILIQESTGKQASLSISSCLHRSCYCIGYSPPASALVATSYKSNTHISLVYYRPTIVSHGVFLKQTNKKTKIPTTHQSQRKFVDTVDSHCRSYSTSVAQRLPLVFCMTQTWKKSWLLPH